MFVCGSQKQKIGLDMKLSRMINFDMKINETSIFFGLVLLSVITEIVWKIFFFLISMFFSSSQDKGFRSPGRNLGSIKYHFFVKNHFRFFVSGLRDKIHFRPFFSNGKELKGKVFEMISPSMWMVRICFILFDITSGRHWKESNFLIFYFWFLFCMNLS